jgi:hypothetical protein
MNVNQFEGSNNWSASVMQVSFVALAEGVSSGLRGNGAQNCSARG